MFSMMHRKRWFDDTVVANPVKLAHPQSLKGEQSSHRLHVLNKVFMDKICDLLTTGEFSSVFTGYGLEITKVRQLCSSLDFCHTN